jgi:steroid delta-isomerase-like uncharacterized protein
MPAFSLSRKKMGRFLTLALLTVPAVLLAGSAQSQTPALPACRTTTEVENTALARAWHDDVINRRNPSILRDILAPEVAHHAAGGYPRLMDAIGITRMMADFLTAFPDLRYTFDQFIAKDDYVVERYTASGKQQGPLGDLPPSGRTATWTGINIFRIECGRIAEVWSEVDAVSRRRQLTGSATAPAR